MVIAMTTDRNEGENAEKSRPEGLEGLLGKIGRAVDSARDTAAAKVAESARNAPAPVREAAGAAMAAGGVVGEKIKRPIDVISLAEFRTEFEQFTQAVSTSVIGVHQDQAALGERLDRLEARLTRLEQWAYGEQSQEPAR